MFYQFRSLAILIFVCISISSCLKSDEDKEPKRPRAEFQQYSWTKLVPEADLEALRNPPAYLDEISDSASPEQVDDIKAKNSEGDRYQQALASTQYIQELDGLPIRIPGYVVPVDFDDNQRMTSFFLVPYFGACIHEPPPPPNQMIYVEVPEGLEHENLSDAVWVLGVLKTEIIENNIAKSAYAMKMHYLDKYGG